MHPSETPEISREVQILDSILDWKNSIDFQTDIWLVRITKFPEEILRWIFNHFSPNGYDTNWRPYQNRWSQYWIFIKWTDWQKTFLDYYEDWTNNCRTNYPNPNPQPGYASEFEKSAVITFDQVLYALSDRVDSGVHLRVAKILEWK